MPEYTFLFDPAASGLEYSITNRAGVEVDAGTLETDADSVEVTVELPWGDYVARAETASGPYVSTRTFYANGSSIAAAGGGGFDYSGEGSPVVNDIDPEEVGVGKTYLDTTYGALYIVINAEEEIVWSLVGGEIHDDLDTQGLILGVGVALVGKSQSGRQSQLSDVNAYNGSGNGIFWTGSGGGVDGDQGLTVQVGPPGSPIFAFQIFSDGGAEFTKDLYVDQTIQAQGAISTKGAEPADGEIGNGECFRWFDSTNGAAKVMFKAKTADGTVVEAELPMA